MDCFIAGTIPIFWGCSLKSMFNEDGILRFTNTKELEDILNTISKRPLEIYKSLYPHALANYQVAKEYNILTTS